MSRRVKVHVAWDADSLEPGEDGELDADEVEVTVYDEEGFDVEEAIADAAEEWCGTHWTDSVHGETECFVRDDAGVVHQVFVTVDFDPVFSARKAKTCDRCAGSGDDPDPRNQKDGKPYRCLRCGGRKLI